MITNIRDASVYTNLGGLNAISQLGREDTAAGLREVAVQFESIFLNMMLKGMRAGEDVLFSENLLRSNEMTFHRENLDNQLSLHMANNGGIGLADALHRQLMERYDAAPREISVDVASLGEGRRFTGSVGRAQADVQPALAMRNIQPRLPEQIPAAVAGTGRAELPPVFASPQEFVERLLPIAERVAPELGVDPTVLLAQSALETGWGQKMIQGADGQPSYNLFGIKASGNWSGDSVSVSTLEFRQGVMAREQASFRAYNSFEESFRDYVELLRSQPRYAPALQHAANPDAYGYHLQKAGYATDPEYADKISRVMRSPVMSDALEQARMSSTKRTRVN